MSSEYEDVEGAIKTALTAEGSPFVGVHTAGAALADTQIAEELQKLGDANRAPAALVFYSGGDTNSGRAGVWQEFATFTVVVVAATRSLEAATRGGTQDVGVFDLLAYCRDALRDLRNATCKNDLTWLRNRRFAIPGLPLTVAAYALEFQTMIEFP